MSKSQLPGGGDAANTPVEDKDDYYVGDNVEDVLAEIGETRAENGYDLTKPDTMPELSFDNATRTFTVAPQAGQPTFHFWSDSKKITKDAVETIVIPDITDTYYIIFDNSGSLQYVPLASIVPENFYENAITGLIYWNATTGMGLPGNEHHGKLMDARTHHYNHSTFGARYESGMDIEGMTDGGDTYTQTTAGYFWDEDIRHNIVTQTTHSFMYRYGADGAWEWTTNSNKVSYNNGGSYDVWNEWDGSTWKLTQGTSSTDYWIIFYMATPDISGDTIKKVIGQNAYSSRSNARNAIDSELSRLATGGLPSPEFVWLFATIVKRTGVIEDDGDGNVYYDLRNEKGGAGGSSVATTIGSDVTLNTTNFDNNLSATDTDVQTALETIDDMAGGGGSIGGLYGVNFENINVSSSTKTLTAGTDKIYQLLTISQFSFLQFSTVGAIEGDRFFVRVDGVSTFSNRILVQQGSTTLCDMYTGSECWFYFDGINWVASSQGFGLSKTAIAIGDYATVWNNSVGIGSSTRATQYSVAIGTNANAGPDDGVAIGYNANSNGYVNTTVIGKDAKTLGHHGVSVGYESTADYHGTSLGNRATSTDYSISIGPSSNTSDNNSLAIGYNAKGNSKYSIALGNSASTKRTGELCLSCGPTTSFRTVTISSRAVTANAAPTELLGAGLDKISIATRSSFTFILIVTGISSVNSLSAGYKFEGAVKRDSAGVSSSVGSIIKTVLGEDDATWDCNVTVDSTENILKIEVVGAASESVYWTSKTDMAEFSF